jgi:hypothetical protein
MWIFLTLISVALIVVVLVDAFEAMVQPRRVTRRYRLTRLYYRTVWTAWRGVARRLPPGKKREAFLSVFGPLSLLALFVVWFAGLILGFGLLHWSLATPLHLSPPEPVDLWTYLYFSGTTFFTLGYGDVTPASTSGQVLAIIEAGTGFGFLAMVVGYLPTLFQAYSRREGTIALLDARAGSPASAAQVLLRAGNAQSIAALDPFLEEWERWLAELLEIHLSFPLLSYYRSQHDNQSWLSALTAILDTCALLLSEVRDTSPYQAQLTFAAARHAAVDLSMIFWITPQVPEQERLPRQRLLQLREELLQAGLPLRDGPATEAKLAELRGMYEPFVNGLGRHFLFSLPPIVPDRAVVDNWQTSAWMRRVPGIGRLPMTEWRDEHFD